MKIAFINNFALFCQLPELVLLKLKCEDADPIVSITACQGVVTLVEVGILGVIPAFSVFIATLPTVRFALFFLVLRYIYCHILSPSSFPVRMSSTQGTYSLESLKPLRFFI